MEKYKILLVSDNPSDLNLIENLISDGNQDSFELDWESTSEKAIKDICFGDYAVTLVNSSVESKSGIELIKEVKQLCPGETVLYVNSLFEGGSGQNAREEGASGNLTKERLTPGNLRANLLDAITKREDKSAPRSVGY